MRWLLGCGISMALASILFVVAASLEWPVLVPISPGHGLSLVDVVALVPLLVGHGWCPRASRPPKTPTGTVARSGSLVVVGGLIGCWGVAG